MEKNNSCSYLVYVRRLHDGNSNSFVLSLQVKAVAAGIDNLIKCDDFAKEQVQETTKAGGGGVDSSYIKWRVGELEFEAWMRLLDSMVRQCESKTQFRC